MTLRKAKYWRSILMPSALCKTDDNWKIIELWDDYCGDYKKTFFLIWPTIDPSWWEEITEKEYKIGIVKNLVELG